MFDGFDSLEVLSTPVRYCVSTTASRGVNSGGGGCNPHPSFWSVGRGGGLGGSWGMCFLVYYAIRMGDKSEAFPKLWKVGPPGFKTDWRHWPLSLCIVWGKLVMWAIMTIGWTVVQKVSARYRKGPLSQKHSRFRVMVRVRVSGLLR